MFVDMIGVDAEQSTNSKKTIHLKKTMNEILKKKKLHCYFIITINNVFPYAIDQLTMFLDDNVSSIERRGGGIGLNRSVYW